MSVKFTDEQLEVINLRDCNVLVSAAAGSGKTAVLTERIVNMVSDEEIFQILSREISLRSKCEQLIEAANRNGGQDNISVVIIDPEI